MSLGSSARANGLINLVCEVSPPIIFNPNQLEILESPSAFFASVENGLKTAKSRIVLSTLYLGTGDLEECLVKTLVENPNRPQVTILADATRSTRPLKLTGKFDGGIEDNMKGSSPLIDSKISPLYLLQRVANLPRGRVALYQSHKLRGLLRRILPERLNETVGLQHMKVFIFDDDVIISGANLSDEYFTTRQDRAWIFRRVSNLADFYADLIDVIASLSYLVTPEGELKATLRETDPVLANKETYCKLFRSRVESFLSSARLKYASNLGDLTHFSSAIFPVVQMGAYGIEQEAPLVLRVLEHLCDCEDCEISLTTGYFCPTSELEDALIAVVHRSNQPPPPVNVLCAAPEANSFFKSRGISGSIPAAYREMLISFLHRIFRHPPSNNIHVDEYLRPGWTFHAKGLWINTPTTTISFVGSSNYGYRSRDLDLETQVVVASCDSKVRQMMEMERSRLWDSRYLRPVTAEELSATTEPRFKWYTRWMLPALRRIM